MVRVREREQEEQRKCKSRDAARFGTDQGYRTMGLDVSLCAFKKARLSQTLRTLVIPRVDR